MKLSANQKNLVKHYVYALVVAGVAIYQTGKHSVKDLAWGALVAVFQPVIESAWLKIKSQKA